MLNDKKTEESISFVARHYRRGAFDTTAGLKALGIRTPWWRRRGVAAAAVAGIMLSATATIFTIYHYTRVEPAPTEMAVPAASAKKTAVVRMEFVDAPLAEVVNEIENVYGVTIGNMPVQDYTLTLSYKGTAADLVETINETLGTNLMILD